MSDERDAEGLVEGREPRNGGISFVTLAYGAVGALCTGVGLLLLQVWINTGRIAVLETDSRGEKTIGIERAASNAARIKQLEDRLERHLEKQEAEIQRVNDRVNAVASACDELRRQHGK